MIFISLFNSYLSLIAQVWIYEVERIESGSEIQRGISIFPIIPVVQLCYIIVFWVSNKIYDDSGIYIISFYAVIAGTINLIRLLKFKRIVTEFNNENKS